MMRRGHRHGPICSQKTRLLCSTGLSYSLLTHIILHKFIRIKQTEAKGRKQGALGKEDKKTLTATENEKKASTSQKRRKQRALGKEDTPKQTMPHILFEQTMPTSNKICGGHKLCIAGFCIHLCTSHLLGV